MDPIDCIPIATHPLRLTLPRPLIVANLRKLPLDPNPGPRHLTSHLAA